MAGSIKDLSKYRHDRSAEELENAKLMLENGRYKSALNRSYYAIFHEFVSAYLKKMDVL